MTSVRNSRIQRAKLPKYDRKLSNVRDSKRRQYPGMYTTARWTYRIFVVTLYLSDRVALD